MSVKQYRLEGLDEKHKITIIRQKDADLTVLQAPLPDQFGFSVGSEFTAPFDAQALAGVLQKLKIPTAGLSRRVGVVTTKFYSNPEPTEISFEMHFHAEYSARHEVMEPTFALMGMSLGKNMTSEDLIAVIDKFRDSIADLTGIESISSGSNSEGANDSSSGGGDIGEWSRSTDGALALIGLIESPETVIIKFGNVYALDNVWISSVTPSFSNTVDAEGFPLSCTCSVNAVLQRDPVIDDLRRFFGVAPEQSQGGQR